MSLTVFISENHQNLNQLSSALELAIKSDIPIDLPRFHCAVPLLLMSSGRGSIDSREGRRWHADLLAKARRVRVGCVDAHNRVESKLWFEKNSCVRLKGNGVKQHTDTRGVLWSDDRYGRWFSRGDKGSLRLQSMLGELQYGRPPADGEFICHICGWCDCIRLEHIRYQSKQEDRADRRHHRQFGRGTIRPALMTLLRG